jgi:hypothetical protein
MSGGAHLLWFILTLLTGFIALPFWIICAICCGSSQKKRDRQLQERQLAILEEMNRVNKFKGWMDK